MRIYTMVDSFSVHEEVASVSRRVLEHLNSVGLRTVSTPTGIQARAGSDFMFRLLGLPLGSKSVPVGLDVEIAPNDDQALITAIAYDRLGWYVNRKLFWGDGVVDRKLTGLLNAVRSATGQSALPERRATFNP